jgi:hypothetical protein
MVEDSNTYLASKRPKLQLFWNAPPHGTIDGVIYAAIGASWVCAEANRQNSVRNNQFTYL